MLAKVRRLFLGSLIAIAAVGAIPAGSQSPSPSANSSADTVMNAAETSKLFPATVFFRGQSAPTQARNSGGVKFGDGRYVLAALIDTSGYSSAVQQRYQAYLITEVAIEVNGHALPPGAYGVGFVVGQFGVMDIGDHPLFSVVAARDADLKRPTPLQVVADGGTGKYRLYEGRDFVVLSPAAQ